MATNEAPDPGERDFPRDATPAQNASSNAGDSLDAHGRTAPKRIRLLRDRPGKNHAAENHDTSDIANNATRGDAPTTGVVVAFPGAVPPKLSEVLERLITEFEQRAVTLREVIVVLQGRAYNLLMLLLALPFLLPLPLPGLSTALGLVIAMIALRLTLGQKPWLPERLLDRELPPRFFPTLLGGARRILRFLEVMLKPRQLWLTASPLLGQLHAFIIFIAAVVLLLPLPPGTNFPPAVCIVIMAGGLLERDGRFILAGYVAFALNFVFFALSAVYIQKSVQAIWQWFTN